MNQVWLAFITGLTTGGISCFAVQGGLLASSLTNQKERQKFLIITFLTSKLVAYLLLGVALGILGSSLVISPKLQGLMQILAGIFMLATVGKLLDLHPVFRQFVITPPKQIFRILRKTSISENAFAPAFLGFLTVLIPCGITQSMMLLSVASGSPFYGSLILGAFVLGTSPVFFGLGLASSQILQRKSLKYVASAAILILALISINTGQVLRGSAHTFQNYWSAITEDVNNQTSPSEVAGVNAQGSQDVEIKVSNFGYQSNVKVLKAGVLVNLKLVTQNTQGCSRNFSIPDLNISKVLPATGEEILEFTPTKKGRLTYTCSMGMYTGYFEVI
ncbi:MAG: putative membrane protein [Microgenomates group bacterium GW2011_GWC1_37_8]|uniref:Putative membrane protein n=1 Tax=Candidatus Woesebacteria bacterium GW2011_GWB1_38_8 TaxID=1618570 RepID=A0A0G0KZB0_9BACT|nr:MAG: putative membrane protein [Microgenomates group bacterium GW2011_GWC1_37_8]KKQ85023.1 MAG: putative membrane protein [Candidatus Woesebacteria bacterium GW2011_GWB1_38_8]